MVETWLPVGCCDLHEVSDHGRGRTLPTPPVIGSRGRMTAGTPLRILPGPRLNLHGIVTHMSVLVLRAHVGEPPLGMEACHWDDDRSNNRLTNLRWDTRSANLLDSVRNGKHYGTKQTTCVNGHDKTPENRLSDGKGCRLCKIYRRPPRLSPDELSSVRRKAALVRWGKEVTA